ncbi:hypothetical protein D0T85_19760 [Bacteroides sp. 519]|nr:hypothetical protein [Bacteroides sp. 519]
MEFPSNHPARWAPLLSQGGESMRHNIKLKLRVTPRNSAFQKRNKTQSHRNTELFLVLNTEVREPNKYGYVLSYQKDFCQPICNICMNNLSFLGGSESEYGGEFFEVKCPSYLRRQTSLLMQMYNYWFYYARYGIFFIIHLFFNKTTKAYIIASILYTLGVYVIVIFYKFIILSSRNLTLIKYSPRLSIYSTTTFLHFFCFFIL